MIFPFLWVFPLPTKSKVFSIFKNFRSYVIKQIQNRYLIFFNAIMVVSSTINLFSFFSPNTTFMFDSHFLTHLNKMGWCNIPFVVSTIFFAPPHSSLSPSRPLGWSSTIDNSHLQLPSHHYSPVSYSFWNSFWFLAHLLTFMCLRMSLLS